ncbi:metallophosphoesterase [Demequina muriae]|uniref:Metallophosphoesterase family protein n=1 Tax=Demequina muriae TaxID=3051664 RepID=A0ABT8GGY0_9MICO|nr:metallophosphoesterase [Demequina sp. EGI L300058]MDN4480690.1 metallophosphoesterase family protein [Demequina sp. EGI L300058]
MSPWVKAAGAVASVGAGVLAWSLLEARSYAVRQVSAPVLAPGSRPIRILHLSDLHLTPGSTHRVEWVRSLARYRPDLVVDTGDNLAHPDAVPTALHALEPLLEFPGVFVHGSNDYYAPRLKNPLAYLRRPTEVHDDATSLDTASLTAGFTAAGWLDLNNARGELEIGGQRVDFVGLDDAHLGRDATPTAVDAVGALRIGVTHAPYRRALEALRGDGASVLLAGHTHGGQVAVPGYGALVTNCDLDTSRASGLHGWPGPRPDAPGGTDSVWLHVSAGVGTSPYTPVRLACRPEVTVLTLMPRGR